jgi:hypothetical protein
MTWTLNSKVISAAWGFFVAVMFLVGAVNYFNNLNNNHALDFDALRSFLPAVLLLVGGMLYSLVGATAVLFDNYGLSAILFLLAFMLFWLFLALGATASSEGERSAYFGIAGTAGGFVFGIPVGGWRPARRQTRGGRAQNGSN